MTSRQASTFPVATAERLLQLLREQREAMARSDPQALAEMESGTERIGQALAELAALTPKPPGTAFETVHATGTPPVDATVLVRLQRELQANQAMLAGLASANRRALGVLFGEPSLYSK